MIFFIYLKTFYVFQNYYKQDKINMRDTTTQSTSDSPAAAATSTTTLITATIGPIVVDCGTDIIPAKKISVYKKRYLKQKNDANGVAGMLDHDHWYKFIGI